MFTIFILNKLFFRSMSTVCRYHVFFKALSIVKKLILKYRLMCKKTKNQKFIVIKKGKHIL